MDLTRTRMERMWFIDAAIRKGGFPNATILARDWAERIGSGRPVDRKTVQRDIDYLRDMYGAPIQFSRKENGFYYADKTWTMPSLRLTEGELLTLLLSRQMGKMYDGTPLEESLTALFVKLRAALSEHVDADPLVLGQQFSFHHHPSRPICQDIWTDIFKSIREKRIMNLRYFGLNDAEASVRDVEPVHLANVDDDWYLVAYCLASDDWRHFSVSRIESAQVREKRFEPRNGFDADQYFADRFGKFIARPGAELHKVVIRFSRDAAPRVRERVWHAKQSLKEEKNGEITLTLPLPSMIEAKRFCLGWGKEATVLAPKTLREEIKLESKTLAAIYATL